MNGVIVIDKPADFTSFDVIAVVRRLTGQRKTGHTGTLDPNATGVLPVLLGAATKAQDRIPNHDKSYLAQFRLGLTTDTLDIWGEVKTETPCCVTEDDVRALLPRFSGEIMQVPPMYSAIKKDGQRLYDLARKGVEVEREARPVTVYRLELVSFDSETQTGELTVSCSKGTYVRTLIDDIGQALGVGAVMTALRRTEACGFTLSDCVTLDRLRQLCGEGVADSVLLPTDSLFAVYPKLTVSDAQATRFSNGGALDLSRTALKNTADDGAICRVYAKSSRFLGLGRVCTDENLLKIEKLFIEK